MDTKFLNTVLSQPTAPFRESHVKTALIAKLKDEQVAHFCDPHGNIVVGASSPGEYGDILARDTAEPVRLFIAHMDHPGFHGVKWTSKTSKELQFTWLGGSPRKFLVGAPVWLADASGLRAEGVMAKPKLNKMGSALESGVVKLAKPLEADAKSLFGSFRFRAPVWWKKNVIYTKAADDLVGAFVIVS